MRRFTVIAGIGLPNFRTCEYGNYIYLTNEMFREWNSFWNQVFGGPHQDRHVPASACRPASPDHCVAPPALRPASRHALSAQPDAWWRSRRFLTATETPDTVPAAVRGLQHALTRGTLFERRLHRCRTTSGDAGCASECDRNCATSRRRQVPPACARMRKRWSTTHRGCNEKDRNSAVGLHGVRRHGSGLGVVVVARLGQLPSTAKAADRHPGRHRSAILAPGASGRWRSAGRCRWKRLRPTWCVRRVHYGDRAD